MSEVTGIRKYSRRGFLLTSLVFMSGCAYPELENWITPVKLNEVNLQCGDGKYELEIILSDIPYKEYRLSILEQYSDQGVISLNASEIAVRSIKVTHQLKPRGKFWDVIVSVKLFTEENVEIDEFNARYLPSPDCY